MGREFVHSEFSHAPDENDGIHLPPAPSIRVQVSETVEAIRRLASLQIAIWRTHLRMMLLHIVLIAILALVVLVLSSVGIVFLLAGIYRVLTDVLMVPRPWALMIFAGGNLLLAGVFGAVAYFMLGKKKDGAKTEEGHERDD